MDGSAFLMLWADDEQLPNSSPADALGVVLVRMGATANEVESVLHRGDGTSLLVVWRKPEV